ncbi:hypothetical protein PO124_06250 [Bacillus licheniformis]|nr:hypothetical protein [Bacillus licheniformis]
MGEVHSEIFKYAGARRHRRFCTAAFVLTGCLWKDPVESFHGSLEKIVELEEPFKQEQGSLKSLEKPNRSFTRK